MYRMVPHLSQRVQRPLLRSTALAILPSGPVAEALTGSSAGDMEGFTAMGPVTMGEPFASAGEAWQATPERPRTRPETNLGAATCEASKTARVSSDANLPTRPPLGALD